MGKVRFDKQSWRRLFVASCRELQTGTLCSADQIRPARVGTHRCGVPGERSALNRDEKARLLFISRIRCPERHCFWIGEVNEELRCLESAKWITRIFRPQIENVASEEARLRATASIVSGNFLTFFETLPCRSRRKRWTIWTK